MDRKKLSKILDALYDGHDGIRWHIEGGAEGYEKKLLRNQRAQKIVLNDMLRLAIRSARIKADQERRRQEREDREWYDQNRT